MPIWRAPAGKRRALPEQRKKRWYRCFLLFSPVRQRWRGRGLLLRQGMCCVAGTGVFLLPQREGPPAWRWLHVRASEVRQSSVNDLDTADYRRPASGLPVCGIPTACRRISDAPAAFALSCLPYRHGRGSDKFAFVAGEISFSGKFENPRRFQYFFELVGFWVSPLYFFDGVRAQAAKSTPFFAEQKAWQGNAWGSFPSPVSRRGSGSEKKHPPGEPEGWKR